MTEVRIEQGDPEPAEALRWWIARPASYEHPGFAPVPRPILTTYIDMDRCRAAMAQSSHNEPISVDDQPPAGYIAPRIDDDDEPGDAADEPDSVDTEPARPGPDPRAVIKLD